ncbi:MAG: fructose PTS transporter subunit IIA, partial [Eubacterium sp.]|nr:fructose PTS transporter subunit IIA [Eubacterium sp.]
MRIVDLLKRDAISLNTSVSTKSEAINSLIALHNKAGNLANSGVFKDAILARESQGTTAIGDGIAVPHAKSDSVKQAGLSAITAPKGIDYNAPDGKPTNIMFMIAAPLDGDLHLEILSRLMVMLMEPEFCNQLRNAKTSDEFLDIIDKKEKEKYPDEPKFKEVQKKGYRILAVTACPTGIAHTYMAAEALEKAGEKLGYSVKAETNGSGGAKNILTKKEIEECDGIIIAADKNVEMSRFNGKPVIKTTVSNGINKPEELIQR